MNKPVIFLMMGLEKKYCAWRHFFPKIIIPWIIKYELQISSFNYDNKIFIKS